MGKQISRIRRRANNQRNINVERNYVIIHHTKVPSFETFQKKNKKKQKENAHIWKLNIFFLFLSIERMLFYYLRRPFYGFCFCFQYWPSRLCGPGGLSSWAWMPQPKMPGRVPREVDLFSSYPCPKQQQQKPQTITNKEHGTTDTGFGRLGGDRWPRQAWRGGRKSREDGPEL